MIADSCCCECYKIFSSRAEVLNWFNASAFRLSFTISRKLCFSPGAFVGANAASETRKEEGLGRAPAPVCFNLLRTKYQTFKLFNIAAMAQHVTTFFGAPTFGRSLVDFGIPFGAPLAPFRFLWAPFRFHFGSFLFNFVRLCFSFGSIWVSFFVIFRRQGSILGRFGLHARLLTPKSAKCVAELTLGINCLARLLLGACLPWARARNYCRRQARSTLGRPGQISECFWNDVERF